MQLQELRPNVWSTEVVLDKFDVRGSVIVGEQRVLVWDTLSHPRDMQGIAELAGEKPIYIAYSHGDWDHCWGTCGLNTEVIIAHDACGKRFETGEIAAKLAAKQAAEPGLWDDVQLVPPNRLFGHMLTVDLGGVLVELHPLAGHTDDCLVAFIPQWGILLAGDTVETPLPFLQEGSIPLLPEWINKLEGWRRTERVRLVVPAHGEIGDRRLIAQNIRYLTDLSVGKPPEVPAKMSAFYTETHISNMRLFGISDLP